MAEEEHTLSSINIKEKLLTYIRSETQNPRITFADPPTPITGCFDTAIYKFQLKKASPDLSKPLVLRIFTRDTNLDSAPFESIIQNSLANIGYPAPKVRARMLRSEIWARTNSLSFSNCTIVMSP